MRERAVLVVTVADVLVLEAFEACVSVLGTAAAGLDVDWSCCAGR